MQKYNGFSPLSPLSDLLSANKSPVTHSAGLSSLTSFNSNDVYTVQVKFLWEFLYLIFSQELKNEYTKALSYIDKLRSEQNNLKVIFLPFW